MGLDWGSCVGLRGFLPEHGPGLPLLRRPAMKEKSVYSALFLMQSPQGHLSASQHPGQESFPPTSCSQLRRLWKSLHPEEHLGGRARSRPKSPPVSPAPPSAIPWQPQPAPSPALSVLSASSSEELGRAGAATASRRKRERAVTNTMQ